MKLAINKLASLDISSIVIESVDLSLYIAHVCVGNNEHVITDRQGKVLKTYVAGNCVFEVPNAHH